MNSISSEEPMHGSLLDTHFFQQVLLRSAPATFPCRWKVLSRCFFFKYLSVYFRGAPWFCSKHSSTKTDVDTVETTVQRQEKRGRKRSKAEPETRVDLQASPERILIPIVWSATVRGEWVCWKCLHGLNLLLFKSAYSADAPVRFVIS